MSSIHSKLSFLVVSIRNELFAFNVEDTIEVDHEQQITVIPNAPKYVKGVINFRGEILPVIDIREKIHKTTIAETAVTIVLSIRNDHKNNMLAVVVDKVIGVVAIQEIDLLPAPDMELSYSKSFITGMFRKDKDFVFILNAPEVTRV